MPRRVFHFSLSQGVFAAMAAFCFVSGVTPGPNHLMLMTSGENFGFRRTLPHLFGVVFGFCLMVALVGLGLGAIFTRFPALLPVMRYLGAAYMLWLAWKIANAGPVREGPARGAPGELADRGGARVRAAA